MAWINHQAFWFQDQCSSYARWLAGIAIYPCFVNIKELPSWIWNPALNLSSLNTYQSICLSPWLGMPQFHQTHLQSSPPNFAVFRKGAGRNPLLFSYHILKNLQSSASLPDLHISKKLWFTLSALLDHPTQPQHDRVDSSFKFMDDSGFPSFKRHLWWWQYCGQGMWAVGEIRISVGWSSNSPVHAHVLMW